ncbi:MAG TPA: response regulator [Bacteroidia bacterium]|jgi:CheY-like chemotaxis protein|nr:response regulator [Bacteroidia bacterium]
MKINPNTSFNILLADDDVDDHTFFKEALKDFSLPTNLTWVHNGDELMQLLTNQANTLPNVLFMDLNMPRKNGFECLSEIKLNDKLKNLPIIIYSTSFHKVIADKLHKNGANYYISKPTEISELKTAVQKMITLIIEENISQPTIEDFVLTNERKNYKTHFWFSHFFRLPLIENFN